MLRLKSLYAENFRSWKYLEIDDFDSGGLVLIRGPNGAGKSSIRHLIEYLLLDKTSDSISLDELVFNRAGNCVLKASILRDEDLVEITKYRGHDEFGNKTILEVNGDASLTTTDRRETQRNIELLLGLDERQLFASTIFTNNSRSFVDSSDSDKKELLYAILSLDKYKLYHSVVKNELELLKDELSDKKIMLNHLEETINKAKNDREYSLKKKEEFEEDRNRKIASLLNKINNIGGFISTEKLENKLSLLERRKEKLNSKKLLSELDDKQLEYNKELANIESEWARLTVSYNNECPVLGIVCDKLAAEAKKLKVKNELLVIDLQKKAEQIRYKLSELRERRNSLINTDLDDKIADLKEKIREIEWNNKSIKKSVVDLKKELKETKYQVNPYIEYVNRKDEELISLTAKLDLLKEKIEKLETDIPYYSFWMEGFGKQGIPNIKADQFLGDLENETNRILSMISDSLYVTIESQKELKRGDLKERIEYKVHSPDRDIMNYNSYSGGEKQRIKLANIFAFNKLIGRFNFILFDEVLEGSMDSKGKNAIVDILKSFSEEIDNIYVISHDSHIQDRFDKVIDVRKRNGVSFL